MGKGSWSASATGTPSGTVDDDRDRAVLMEFYRDTGGVSWKNNTNWGSTVPFDQWYGVDAENGRVTVLSLPSNRVTGVIPSSLGDLTSLTKLDLRGSEFTGSIPSTLGNLRNLTELLLSGPLTG